MPSLQTVQVTDRTPSTPVTYTLIPTQQAVGGVARVAAADASGNVMSEKSLTISTKRTGTRLRTTMKFAVPIMVSETINGVSVTRVDRVSYVDVTFSLPISGSEQERNDVVGMFQSLFAVSKPLVHDTVVKAQGVW